MDLPHASRTTCGFGKKWIIKFFCSANTIIEVSLTVNFTFTL